MSTQYVSPLNRCRPSAPSWRVEGGAPFYHPELDALRFCAFLAVFFHHALPGEVTTYVDAGLPPAAARWLLTAKGAGAYGVDLFFTLSSYLITELLVREHLSRGAINVGAFYARRALRIWPLYFAFLLTVLLAAASYRWLERPFLRLKERFTRVPSGAATADARPSPAGVGVMGSASGGRLAVSADGGGSSGPG